jgi:flagellar basal body-associated protein FliL
VNFLIKLEEAINAFLEKLIDQLKAVTPDFVFAFFYGLKNLPQTIKNKWKKIYQPKLRITGLKFVGYTEHYTTLFRGCITAVFIYLRSDDFKKANKKDLMLKPLQYAKFNPFKALSILSVVAFSLIAGVVIFSNTAKIVSGTYALRKPASFESAEEDVFVEFKNHKFEVKLGGGAGHGEGHGEEGGAAEEEPEIQLDVKIEAHNETEKAFLESMEEMIDDNLEALTLPLSELPMNAENQKQIELMMAKSLNEDFKNIGHPNSIKSVQVKQKLSGRPVYYKQAERMMKVEDINLQLFLEDTHRNRQVWIDFSLLASNRNVILYLTEHEVELKDHLTTNVEPVLPQLPVEEEGRQIIKDKIRTEINEFLQKNHIEGKILDVYIDYLIAS